MPLPGGERMVVVAHEATEKFNSNTEEWTFKVWVSNKKLDFLNFNFFDFLNFRFLTISFNRIFDF